MEFTVKEIKSKEFWESFIAQVGEKTFLQSWNWGEFQKMMGNSIWRLGIFEGGNLAGVALVVKIAAKRGKFLFVPHGPMMKAQSSKLKAQSLEILLKELKKIARQESCSFVRVASVWERSEKNKEIFRNLGFRDSPIHQHPELTWQLDITLPEEQLLRNMRKTTRYLIRRALKNPDLKIEKSQNPRDVEIFNRLYQRTVDRHSFHPFSFQYLKNEFLAFSEPARPAGGDNQILIFLAKYKDKHLASALIIFWQGIGFYHQGASTPSKVPASYLLQWEAIREAKRRGCELYNFWGIAPGNSKRHPWAGLTLFKTGFGGYEKEYLKTQDFPLSFLYWLTFVFEKIRKIKRGL